MRTAYSRFDIFQKSDISAAELDAVLALHGAEQAGKGTAVHPQIAGHLLTRHAGTDDLARFPGLLLQIRFQSRPPVRDGQEADMGLQRPVFCRNFLQQIGQQPTLSHAIAQLERELGVPLFEKSGRGTVLTQYGRQFLDCTEQALGILDAGIEELQRVSCGEGLIRLGLLRTLGVEFVPELARAFLLEHPEKISDSHFRSGRPAHFCKHCASGSWILLLRHALLRTRT